MRKRTCEDRVLSLSNPDSPHAPEQLWEWERPYIIRLLRNATTFNPAAVHCYFADWEALAQENRRIWETSYQPRRLYEPWERWQVWMAEYRQIIRDVQEIAEEHNGRMIDDPPQARQHG